MLTDDDGNSVRDVLRGMVERSIQSGKPESHRAAWEAELAGEPMPPELIYLWKIYNRLRARQGSNGWGQSPIGWTAIDAYVRNSRCALAPWEIETIEMIDNLYLSATAKAPRKTEA